MLERTKKEMATYEDYANNGSLLLGDVGMALLIMRLAFRQSRPAALRLDADNSTIDGEAAGPGADRLSRFTHTWR